MNSAKTTIHFCLLLFAAIITAWIALPDFFIRPHKIILQLGGDGIKNLYAYLYHSMYGRGVWFEGMNYPQGEHIVYTDGIPVLSVGLSYLRSYIHLSQGQYIAIMHLSILVSYVWGYMYTAFILRHFKVNTVVTIIATSLIILLSPQTFRIFGHYGLSFFSAVPMLLYWSIKYHELSARRYLLYIFVSGLVFTFCHPYYAALFLVFGTTYSFSYFLLIKGTFKKKFLHVLPYIASIGFILVVFKMIMMLTDPVKDRPVEPIGILSGCTRLPDIVSSNFSAIWSAIGPALGVHPAGITEGAAYVGIAVIIIVLVSGMGWVFRYFRIHSELAIVAANLNFQPVWLLVAILSLLVGIGVPFIWGMEWMFDYMAAFRQFRSLGRFSIIYYYIGTIYAVVSMYRWHVYRASQGKKLTSGLLMGLLAAVWGYEASGYVLYCRDIQGNAAIAQYNFFTKEKTSWTDFLHAHNYVPNDFQAIIVYPYIHVGTEKIAIDGDKLWAFTLASSASQQLKLPIVNVMMSRSSWSQAFERVKLAGGTLTDKSFLSKVNKKPFLLIHSKNYEIGRDAQYLFEISDFIGNFSDCDLYVCYPEHILQHQRNAISGTASILSQMNTADTVFGTRAKCYIQHCDTGRAVPLWGSNSYQPLPDQSASLCDFDVQNAPDSASQEYEFSAWALLPSNSYRGPEIKLEMYDSAYNDIGSVLINYKTATDFEGMWFRLAAYVSVPSSCRHIRCKVINIPSPSYLALDEILFRPVDATVISKDEKGRVMMNGHLLKTISKQEKHP
jgi:hypothetical protein